MPRKGYQSGLYASATTVDPAKTMQEIVTVLKKHGAIQHFSGEDERRAMVGFSVRGRQIRFTVPYPAKDPRDANDVHQRRDAEIRRRWRCLLLSIKAKFENVTIAESISPEHATNTFRAEFLAETVLKEGKTVAEVVMPLIDKNYTAGQPLMLPGMGEED